jgi:hypothetical protein
MKSSIISQAKWRDHCFNFPQLQTPRVLQITKVYTFGMGMALAWALSKIRVGCYGPLAAICRGHIWYTFD